MPEAFSRCYPIITPTETLRDYRTEIVEQATSLLGSLSVRYIMDHPGLGESPDAGFDCSGFVRFVLVKSGLSLPDFIGMDRRVRPIRHCNELWDHYGIAVHRQPRPADLIFFARHGLFPTHIGIVRDEESYIHAPGKDGTKVTVAAIPERTPVSNAGVMDLIYPYNPIGFKSPAIPIANPTYRHHQQPI